MNLQDLEKALNLIDEMYAKIEADPVMVKVLGSIELDKTRKRIIRETRKELLDEDMLRGLVLIFELLGAPKYGVTRDETYERVASKDFSKFRVKKLWNDTRIDNPEKIDYLCYQLAYAIVSQFIERQIRDQTNSSGADFMVFQLKKNRPALYHWAWKKTIQNYLGEKYEEPDEALEVETIALMRKTAWPD